MRCVRPGSNTTPKVSRRVGDVGAEGVGVVAVGVVDELIGLRGRFWIGRCLQSPRPAPALPPGPEPTLLAPVGRLDPRDVALPARRIAVARRHQLGDGETHVGELQALLDRAVGEHREVDDRRAAHRSRPARRRPAAPRTPTTSWSTCRWRGWPRPQRSRAAHRPGRRRRDGHADAVAATTGQRRQTKAAAPNHFIELFIDDSITSWARPSWAPPSSCR